ncbi:MAG: type II toxin-antitoxin system prevent-host-death family antitoxin [Pseudomonadota bacterium]
MHVSIHEFKSHLSRYVGRVQAGESIELTSHRRVVALITGVPKTTDQGIAKLLASGAASWNGGKPGGASLELDPRGIPVSQIVLEDRG